MLLLLPPRSSVGEEAALGASRCVHGSASPIGWCERLRGCVHERSHVCVVCVCVCEESHVCDPGARHVRPARTALATEVRACTCAECQ